MALIMEPWRALLASVFIQVAHASPAIGNDVRLIPKLRAPHEVSARAINIAVLKAPDEIERLLLRNDRPHTSLRKNRCSDLRTSGVELENIAVFGSDYLRTKRPLGSHYLRMSAHYLRRAHLVENDAEVVRTDDGRHNASPTARIRSASSRVRPASSWPLRKRRISLGLAWN